MKRWTFLYAQDHLGTDADEERIRLLRPDFRARFVQHLEVDSREVDPLETLAATKSADHPRHELVDRERVRVHDLVRWVGHETLEEPVPGVFRPGQSAMQKSSLSSVWVNSQRT